MPLEPEFLTTCAQAFVDLASRLGLKLRVMGGVAARIRCPNMGANGFARPFHRNDIDFVADASQIASLNDLMLGSRCVLKVTHQYWGGEHRRYEYRSEQGINLAVDVYFGLLRFNHEIPEPYFSEASRYTIPITQLLLSKLAIVEIREVDMRDAAAILAEHSIGYNNDRDVLRPRVLLKAWCTGCSGWGLAKTCANNIAAIRQHVAAISSTPTAVTSLVTQRLDDLERLGVKCSKSACWRTRAAVGTSFLGKPVQWYNTVRPGEEEDGNL
jgi:hypothetical protein